MPAAKKRHLVDGQMLTVEEIAEMLGTSPGSLATWRSTHMRGMPWQATVNAYRQYGPRFYRDKAPRYLINGAWITFSDAARQLGTTPGNLHAFRIKHRGPDGRLLPLDEIMRIYPHRNRKTGPGKDHRKRYNVDGKMLTRIQIGEKYGINLRAFEYHITHKKTYEETVHYLLDKREKRAVNEIMRILKEAKTR